MRRWAWTIAAGFAAMGGCDSAESARQAAGGQASPADGRGVRGALPDFFDCVREAGGLMIAAHRGGPAPGYPENALETLAHARAAGIYVFEIDVAESRDGVLFLHHDRSLTRTTTLSGAVADADWADIRAATLIDNDGRETSFRPTPLTDVLVWAVENNALLELDRKPTTSFRNIISAVRAAEAEDHVLLIAYTADQAAEITAVAPDLMLSAGARGADDVSELVDRGVDPARLLGWTGTSEPDPGAWSRLRAEGVEPAFGTLGRPGDRLDDAYWADGDPSEYREFVDAGLTLLSTDEPYRVTDALDADDVALAACGG